MRNSLRIGNREGGAAMVEFAIVFPLLVLLVFGIIEFGRAYNAQITLTHAAREAAREYAISQDQSAGQATAEATASSLNPGDMSYTWQVCDSSSIGDPSGVTISYPMQLLIPFFPGGPITLSAEGVMRCGG
jgi:Flp pilus assembly protein TadG